MHFLGFDHKSKNNAPYVVVGKIYFFESGNFFEVYVGGYVHKQKRYLLGVEGLCTTTYKEVKDFQDNQK